MVIEDLKFITSPDGPSSPNFASIWATLSSFVAHAIAGCIRDGTLPESSYTGALTVEENYIIERGLFETATGALEWRPITKTDQVKGIGNSVCPDVAEALARANAADLIRLYAREASAA